MSTDTKLQAMQERVQEASERNARRIADRASAVRDSTAEFVGRHPGKAVAGGLLAGVIIAVALPKLNRRRKKAAASAAATTTSDVRNKALKWAALAADAAITFAQQSIDSARDAGHAGQKSLDQLGDRVTDGTAGLRKEIGRYAGEAAHNVRSAGEQASQQAKSVASRISARLRH